VIPLHAADRSQKRAHHPGLLRLVVGLAIDLGLRAARRLYSGAGRAALGLRAGYDGAAGSGARRALTDLAGLVARADAGRAGGNGRLEDIAAHVGRRGALRLQHVAAHVGLRWASGNRSLEHILGPVDLGTLVSVSRA
jgi:hypothetical protein